MAESLHEMAVRLRGRCGGDCTGCKYKGTPCLISVLCHVDNADEQLEDLKRWAEEHPRKTWIDLLREKLPDSEYVRDHNLHPAECPHGLLGGSAPAGDDDLCRIKLCRECWNGEAEVIEE